MKYLTLENLQIIGIIYCLGIFVSSILYYYLNYWLLKNGMKGDSNTWRFIKCNIFWPKFWISFIWSVFVIRMANRIYMINNHNLNLFGDQLKAEILNEIKEECLKNPAEIQNNKEILENIFNVINQMKGGKVNLSEDKVDNKTDNS